MIFISETNLGHSALPSFKDFTTVADPSKKVCNYGGIAWYVRNSLARHMFQVQFNESYISFRLKLVPKIVFIGVYVQPEGARHFNIDMFAEVGALLVDCDQKGLIPYVGGDFNSRPGDFHLINTDTSWIYESNIDSNTNKHGKTLFRDLCCAGKVKPINGMKYYGRTFDNNFTFIRSNGQSQIDFCLTNSTGRRNVKNFQILVNDWHISDHRPISLEIETECKTDLGWLLKRANDLNSSSSDSVNEVHQFRGNFDYEAMELELLQQQDRIERAIEIKLQNDDVQGAIDTLDVCLKDVHKNHKIKRMKQPSQRADFTVVNKAFDEYVKGLSDEHVPEAKVQELLDKYVTARKSLTTEVMKKDAEVWVDVLKKNDAKSFWKLVDWKGNLKQNKALNSPSIQQFEVFFEELYKCKNKRELIDIMEIHTNKSVDALDKPIDDEEVKTAFKSMKKSGFDYNLPVLSILVTYFTLMVVNIMNAIFHVKYPISLAFSLLSLIPKKGNLMLPKNFRGIQMMKSFAVLFDRIITNRLKSWLNFNVDQTAFQKLKSTLIHIFTLRILIDIAKKQKVTLYIGSVDIEKAFDHVPRSLLLKKLVTIGVGRLMLFALKEIYMFSVCVIKFQDELSDTFRMYRGVRQGAASSVLLFNAFMDGLFNHLEGKCSAETLIHTIHALIHADDTIILSTSRESFIHKCNETIRFFQTNKLNLNIDKSAFLIINPKLNDRKSSLVLNSGVLKYKSSFEYLGVIISDTGVLKNDVNSYVVKKSANVTVKFTNFCRTNKNAPFHVKLDVLDKCVTSSLLYGCETWANCITDVEQPYRSGLKIALNVRQNLNNEIVHLETGRSPLCGRIKSLQLKFWLFVTTKYMTEFPESALAKVVKIGIDCNSKYVKYYTDLQAEYTNPTACKMAIDRSYLEHCKSKLIAKNIEDPDSKLGTYYRVNPTLSNNVRNPQIIMEFERELVTRFRTGSHSLAVETGRYSNIIRENRLCSCGNSVQTVWHVVAECCETRDIVPNRYNNLQEVFDDANIYSVLLAVTRKLKIRIR